MESNSQNFKIRLGLFVLGGIIILIVAILIIGKQKNIFNPVFKISTQFYNVSGLQVGCIIRFSGTNIGTVDNIEITNDSTVRVDMIIRTEYRKFIKADCKASISSEGIIGDKLLIISRGSSSAKTVTMNAYLESIEPIEINDVVTSLMVTAENAEIISNELAKILLKINSGRGTLGRLLQDTNFAKSVNQTMINLESSSKSLDENMEAIKGNFLLKGYYKKKEKAAEKR